MCSFALLAISLKGCYNLQDVSSLSASKFKPKFVVLKFKAAHI